MPNSWYARRLSITMQAGRHAPAIVKSGIDRFERVHRQARKGPKATGVRRFGVGAHRAPHLLLLAAKEPLTLD
jgi:hypothetical protein